MANRWQKVFTVAGAANRFRINGEEARRARFELIETQRLAMMAALALRPQDAHSRAFREAQMWPHVDEPMHRVNDVLAVLGPRDAHARALRQEQIFPRIPGAFNLFE